MPTGWCGPGRSWGRALCEGMRSRREVGDQGGKGAYQATSAGAERGQRAGLPQNRSGVEAGGVGRRGRARGACCPRGARAGTRPLLHREPRRQEAAVSPEQQVQVPGEGRDPQQHLVAVRLGRLGRGRGRGRLWGRWLPRGRGARGQGGSPAACPRQLLRFQLLVVLGRRRRRGPGLGPSLRGPLRRRRSRGAHLAGAADRLRPGASAAPRAAHPAWVRAAPAAAGRVHRLPAPKRRKHDFPLLAVGGELQPCGRGRQRSAG